MQSSCILVDIVAIFKEEQVGIFDAKYEPRVRMQNWNPVQ